MEALPDYIGVFERRNLIAQGERKFNKRYVSICTDAGHKGSEKVLVYNIELTSKYLNQACDVLLEFAILLPFALWRTVARDKESQAFSNLNEAAYKLISSRRYVPAERVLEFALSLEKVNVSQDVRQRLVVNRASAVRHLGHDVKAKQILDEVDWSASSDLFIMGVASVHGDGCQVAKLLPNVAAVRAIDARSCKEWPCFTFVREDTDVRSAFQEVFGQSLAATGDVSSGAEDSSERPAHGMSSNAVLPTTSAAEASPNSGSEKKSGTIH